MMIIIFLYKRINQNSIAMVKMGTPSPRRKIDLEIVCTEVDKLEWEEAETYAKCKKKLAVKISGFHREMEKQQ